MRTRRRKQKIKKLIILCLIVIIIIVSLIMLFKMLFKKETNLFNNINNYQANYYDDYMKYYDKNKNSDKEDIVNFINYCKNNSLDYDEISIDLIKFYKLNNFDLANLNRYLDYYKNHKDSDLLQIINIVNSDLESVSLEYCEEINIFLLNLINEKYYIKDNLKRYINYYQKITGFDYKEPYNTKEIITNVNANLDYNFYENTEITDISKDTLMIVNKHYKIPDDYKPKNLVYIDDWEYGYWNLIRADVYEEFKKMSKEAKKDNVTLFIASPYRSYNDQKVLYNSYVANDGVKNADTYSARPGYSEHHTGLAMDLIPEFGLQLDTFENSAGFKWMQENAHKYGFILRYPKDKEYITGYMYEPWHYRYVGVDAATTIKNEGLTFEEYYEYYVK